MSESNRRFGRQEPGLEHGPRRSHDRQAVTYRLLAPRSVQHRECSDEGARLARSSLILGVISLIAGLAGVKIFLPGIIGVVLGTLALVQASKAEKYGSPATVGKVAGYIGLALSLACLIWLVLALSAAFLLAFMFAQSGG